MKRISSILFGGMLVLSALVLFAARAQPEDTDLRALLLPPEGCFMPCWAGIQPGVTTVDEAMAILRAHPWVRAETVFSVPTQIMWLWDYQHPSVAEYISPEFSASYIYVRGDIVRYIRVATTVPYGEIHTLMGAPSSGIFSIIYPHPTNPDYLHSAGYFGGSVVYDTDIPCPATPYQFWNAPVRITYSDGSYHTLYSMPDYDLTQRLYRKPCAI